MKEFINAQKAFNTTIEENLNKIDDMSRNIDRISHDVENLKNNIFPKVDIRESIKALYVSIYDSKKRTTILGAKRELLERAFSNCFHKNDAEIKMIGVSSIDSLFFNVKINDEGTQ